MKNSVLGYVLYGVLYFVLYALLPILYRLSPDFFSYYEVLLDLWIFGPIVSFGLSAFICRKEGFVFFVPVICGLAFLAAMFVFYDIGRFPFLIGYIVLSLMGCFFGQYLYSQHMKEIY